MRTRICGARTRSLVAKYARCHAYPLKGRRRCRMHGGRNTWGCGAIGTRDTRKAFAARLKYDALRRFFGLNHPGGPRRKQQTVKKMAEEAKAVLIEGGRELESALPQDVMTRAIEELRPAEALGRAALSGSYQLIRIIEQPLDMDDLKQQRLIGDMAAVALRLFVRAAEGEYKKRQTDALGELLAAIRAEQAEGSNPG